MKKKATTATPATLVANANARHDAMPDELLGFAPRVAKTRRLFAILDGTGTNEYHVSPHGRPPPFHSQNHTHLHPVPVREAQEVPDVSQKRLLAMCYHVQRALTRARPSTAHDQPNVKSQKRRVRREAPRHKMPRQTPHNHTAVRAHVRLYT